MRKKHRKANMLAAACGMSLNAWVVECLGQAVSE